MGYIGGGGGYIGYTPPSGGGGGEVDPTDLDNHKVSGDHDGRYTRRSLNLSDLNSAEGARSNLGLGSGALADLQSVLDDSTAGLLLQVGSFGVGRSFELNSGVDLNTVDSSGFYQLTATHTNLPTGTEFGQLLVSSGERSILQVASDLFGTRIYWRVGDDNDGYLWQPWRELVHDGNVGQRTAPNIRVITSNTTAQINDFCVVTTSGRTITLPAIGGLYAGARVIIGVGDFTNTTIARNGHNIMSLEENFTIDKPHVAVTLVYVNSTIGWRIV